MLRLAERMVTSFCGGVSASTAHQWTTVSGNGAEDVRVMTRKSVGDPGRPPGIVLNAAKSFWLPVPQKRVFDFLRDERSRNEVNTILSLHNLSRFLTSQFWCIDSGISFQMVVAFKKWLTSPMAETTATASLFSESM